MMNKRMLVGKRSRKPMKRTRSTTALCNVKHLRDHSLTGPSPEFPNDDFVNDQRFLALLSSTTPVPQIAPFLQSCCLCNRRLAPTRDIFMYRGDTAFCSEKCRQQQMNRDERKKRLNQFVASNKQYDLHLSSTSNPDPSSKTEPLAAA